MESDALKLLKDYAGRIGSASEPDPTETVVIGSRARVSRVPALLAFSVYGADAAAPAVLGRRLLAAVDEGLSDPRLAAAMGLTGLLAIALVGAGAPNVNTLGVALPQDMLPAWSPSVSYALMILGSMCDTLAVVSALKAYRSGWRPNPRALLLVGALAVALLVDVAPVGSSDIGSYADYGRIAATGGDPYVTVPSTFGGPYLKVVSVIWRSTPSVYGPVATWTQAGAALLGGNRPWATVWVLMACNGVMFLAVGWLLMRASRDPVRAGLLWVANPLLLQVLVAGGHLDTLLAAPTAAAIIVLRHGNRRWHDLVAGAFIGLACAIKVDAGLLGFAAVLWFARTKSWGRMSRVVVAAAATAVALYYPYGLHALVPLEAASKLIAEQTLWYLPVMAARDLVGSAATSAIIHFLWPIAMVLTALVLRRVCLVSDHEPAGIATLWFLAWIIAAPWSMPWYTAPAWVGLASARPTRLARYVVVTTAILALIHNSGGHGW
jgi:hypothetical protein